MQPGHIGAVIGALGLHALVVVLIWGSSPERSGPNPSPVSVTLHAVLLPHADGQMPKTSAPGFKADSPGGPTTARRPAQSAPAHPDESIPATDSLHRENYRAADAVDQVPVPVGEWAINTSLLPVSKPCVFVVTIWVSARGRLDKWEVQSDQISEERAAAVFEQFGDTVMNPALIGDVPVASVQRLELTIERQ